MVCVAAEAIHHIFDLTTVPLVVGVEVGPNWADLARIEGAP